ncbi:hypothetical protein A2276_04150 [candidate division WOR-1 bacterium RIFOXYA12_FULL_43_27]|uniref:Sulfatase-modifying factor enzyme-like domain-containing protein n=1 Tax=candidate division WOR-1 bacterium RIFOXYC2_FULL_46_14 TaxID=1802587 RepID=A0A1F4U6X2_UNCSA|nr:MAG: hypothetical protein A2276_04150 [candidate division WOR-1 bacterium RIFOXYA12_FULL_43_27]OGC19118.1 MAG: hypothetical protein A2292_00185 [candidate division WOR-1 bacterium RIFOXYB2_FULL_46_45]OGC30106.1 MAG: hypothetical protein A2232_00185 [candidate division WOR-1 bacterium RIFOXYA2_FULL_46_56]OGC40708.1 MAG: hypothetical protein A2438_00190 [candidate division WOR-1 bacterium RIFOXYC2_FULL_46_14]
MINFKLIAFEGIKIDAEAVEAAGRALLERLQGNPDAGDPEMVNALRAVGLPISRPLVRKMIANGAMKAYLEERFVVATSLDLGMLDVPGENFRFMAGKITREMFRLFAKEEKYTPAGHNSDKLLEIIGSENAPLSDIVFVNMDDVNAFIAWARKKTGKKLRLPTEKEWLIAVRALRSQLKRITNFEWTSTDYAGTKKVLLSEEDDEYLYDYDLPEFRFLILSFRLVEDL